MRILFLLIALLSLQTYAQIKFENGYFIDNNNQKTACLIKNVDWKNNPNSFEFKTSENGTIETATISNVKEFGIAGIIKFVRHEVKIDRSSEITSNLTYEKEPNFTKEILFLKFIVEGKANLYEFEDGSLKKYFFNVDETAVEQLVFKTYLTKGEIARNNQFRQQIFLSMRCDGTDIEDIEKLEYKEANLTKFFVNYNTCSKADFKNYNEKEKQDLINLNIRPRFVNSSLEISNPSAAYIDYDFGSKTNFGLGVELEIILPFNKNKWAVAIEPTYHSFQAEKNSYIPNTTVYYVGKVNYKSIEIPISLRHYFFLNKNSKIFANVSYVIDFTTKATFEVKPSIENSPSLFVYDLDTVGNVGLGLGYKFQDKYSLEFRYHTERNVLNNEVGWNSGYNTFALILGYTLL